MESIIIIQVTKISAQGGVVAERVLGRSWVLFDLKVESSEFINAVDVGCEEKTGVKDTPKVLCLIVGMGGNCIR